MKGIPYGWLTWAALNATASAGASTEYLAAHAAGLGPVTAGLVTLAAHTKALTDLNAVYGPSTAVLGPVLATGSSLVCDGHSAVPAAVSVGLATLAHCAAHRKGTAS
jgi:hypothetical protein